MAKMRLIVIVSLLALLTSSFLFAKNIKTYDQNRNLRYGIDNGSIYDKNWNLKGRIEGNKVYDKDWKLKYMIENSRIYNRDWKIKMNILKDDKIFDKVGRLKAGKNKFLIKDYIQTPKILLDSFLI